MSRQFAVAIVTILLAVPRPCAAATYCVDQRMPGASDANAGTEQAPWKTIVHAAEVAQPGDTVLIRTGVYREAVVAKRSGSADRPIRFQADAASTVVVTG